MVEERWYANPWVRGGFALGVALVLGVVGWGALGVGGGYWAISDAGLEEAAVQMVQQDATLAERLGEPLRVGWLSATGDVGGWLTGGGIRYTADGQAASYSVPISGSKAEASLFIDAVRRGGEWSISGLSVQFNGETARRRIL